MRELQIFNLVKENKRLNLFPTQTCLGCEANLSSNSPLSIVFTDIEAVVFRPGKTTVSPLLVENGRNYFILIP